MKLVAAKCPSCGANIDVDKDSDSTKCEFCHSRIIVEEAIEKIKVDVEIKNLPIYENYLELADRYFSEYLYEDARIEYKKALELNPKDTKLIFREKICRACISDINIPGENIIMDALNGVKNIDNINKEIDVYVSNCLDAISYIINKTMKYYNHNILSFDQVAKIHYKIQSCSEVYRHVGSYINSNNIKFRIVYLDNYITYMNLLLSDFRFKSNDSSIEEKLHIPYNVRKMYKDIIKLAEKEKEAILNGNIPTKNEKYLYLPDTSKFEENFPKILFIGFLCFNALFFKIAFDKQSYFYELLFGISIILQCVEIIKMKRDKLNLKKSNDICIIAFLIIVVIFLISKII